MSPISTDHKMRTRRSVGAPRPPPVTQQQRQLTHSHIVIFKCPVNVHDYIGFCCMDTKTLLGNCITFCPAHKYISDEMHDFRVQVNWTVYLSTNSNSLKTSQKLVLRDTSRWFITLLRVRIRLTNASTTYVLITAARNSIIWT